ncbi:aminotransferase class I/II-fold pyridoxal phosphate-dependent enzyme [Salinifilum ghardaiensis]
MLFFDDAHGTSVVGTHGEGPVLDRMDSINDRTVVVTSLNKGFGASGGAILFGPRGKTKMRHHLLRSGGPFMWSQRLNTAALGAIEASIDIHRSPELPILQERLVKNVQEFDASGLVEGSDNTWPVRFIPLGDEKRTIDASKKLLERGFYVEPDFFPVVARGHGGLRVRIRANMETEDIVRFTEVVREVLEDPAL